MLAVLLLTIGLTACQSSGDGSAGGEAEETDAPPVVEVTALDYAFQAPDTIRSGWTTFRLKNKAEEIHEIELGRLPEEVTYADYVETIPFWDTITARVEAGELVGRREVHAAPVPNVPNWSPQFITSLGLISPGRTAEKTEYLAPGTYVMPCFVKSPDGQTHLSKGMHRKLVVRDDSTGATEPDADVEVRVGGDTVNQDGALSRGTNTIAARFAEESKGPQAINLIRVEEDTDLEAVEQWMNWYTKGGLMAPAPAEFLGGDNIHSEAPKGSVAYFTVEDLEPGRYAWVVWTSEGAFSETVTVE
ncbi:MAG: hypothetical protein V5A22_10340 [Salinivenus sp.]